MKFRFCGDGDCPDWVLAEIISTLSILNTNQLEELAALVAKRISGEEFQESSIKSICSELTDNGKSAVATIHFLLINATRHSVSEMVFNEEIQQLGLPKEHANAMCRVLSTYVEAIRHTLIARSFKINELSSVKYIPTKSDAASDCGTFELKISQELVDGLPEDTTHLLNIDYSNMRALLTELKKARSIMEKYDEN